MDFFPRLTETYEPSRKNNKIGTVTYESRGRVVSSIIDGRASLLADAIVTIILLVNAESGEFWTGVGIVKFFYCVCLSAFLYFSLYNLLVIKYNRGGP